MKVGTICKLKVDCLGNKAGTLGVVFYDYGDGFQAIFENGNYDGFERERAGLYEEKTEADHFLEEVGFEESLAGYQFKNVLQVVADYKHGLFNIAWSEGWKKSAEITKPEPIDADYFPDEYERCEVCVEDGKFPWLYFKREKDADSGAIYMLSAAMDYADFSHFEYADIGPSIFPRLLHTEVTLYPKYVVFRKGV